jgi:hypothetical protein
MQANGLRARNVFLCNLCSKTFPTYEDVKAHVADGHNQAVPTIRAKNSSVQAKIATTIAYALANGTNSFVSAGAAAIAAGSTVIKPKKQNGVSANSSGKVTKQYQ